MSTSIAVASDATHLTPQPWPPSLRVAFRFVFVYFALFVLATQIINSIFSIPNVEVPDWATLWPIRLGVVWVAQHIFRVKSELVYSGSGSGDKTFDWVLVFCLLVVSVIATTLWTLLDRRRFAYPSLRRWFHLFLRIALGSQMLTYGLDKAVPLQMPAPFLTQLLEPYGQKSPMGVLWSFVGASPAYEVVTGCAELLGGILLIFPRTLTLGALVCLADMTQVFVLNMTYDVPVKLLSFHLIAMSLLLLAPQSQRLANFFLLNRPAEPLPSTRLLASRRGNRITLAIVAFLWLWMIGTNIYGALSAWHEYGGGRVKSALYGVWNVEEMSIDGEIRPPLLTDKMRVRRIVFDFPDFATFMAADDSRTNYDAGIDTLSGRLTLTKGNDKSWKSILAYTRPAPGQLTLSGSMDNHAIVIKLQLMDAKFPLNSRGFHWIQEYPFNR